LSVEAFAVEHLRAVDKVKLHAPLITADLFAAVEYADEAVVAGERNREAGQHNRRLRNLARHLPVVRQKDGDAVALRAERGRKRGNNVGKTAGLGVGSTFGGCEDDMHGSKQSTPGLRVAGVACG